MATLGQLRATTAAATAIVLIAPYLVGCIPKAARTNNPLRELEQTLGTDGRLNWGFHRIVEDPNGFGLHYPGILIGLEKTKKKVLFGNGNKADWKKRLREHMGVWCNSDSKNDKITEDYCELLDDPKSTFISHVAAYQTDRKPFSYTRPCFLYSAYSSFGVFPCSGYKRQPPSDPYAGSWNALQRIERYIEEEFDRASEAGQPYSHILLYSMGWNTPQQEAVRNYNSLGKGLLGAAAEAKERDFRPYLVGLSWPSKWSVPLVSLLNKANDADEIGFVWVNYLTHKTLSRFKRERGVRVVLVGHSLGGRLLSRAAFSDRFLPSGLPGGEVAMGSDTEPSEQSIDLLVLLEAAFSANRFIPERSAGREGAPYRDHNHQVRTTVLTWSEHDKANPLANLATGANYVGGKPGFERMSDCRYRRRFTHYLWETPGSGPDCVDAVCLQKKELPACPPASSVVAVDDSYRPVVVIDASEIIRYGTYRKGGLAHSDIYNPLAADAFWNLIERYAPTPSMAGR